MSEPHYCSDACRCNERPCWLCLAQERTLVEDRKRANGKPTLTHNPFAKLLEKRHG
jgi:hypothetical protein